MFARVAEREFDPVSLISLCPKCNFLARVYVGMDASDETTVKKFECANCAHSDSEPMG